MVAWLVMLQHCSSCRAAPGECPAKTDCYIGKRLLQHIRVHGGKVPQTCDYPCCQQTMQLLSHYNACKPKSSCPVCGPVSLYMRTCKTADLVAQQRRKIMGSKASRPSARGHARHKEGFVHPIAAAAAAAEAAAAAAAAASGSGGMASTSSGGGSGGGNSSLSCMLGSAPDGSTAWQQQQQQHAAASAMFGSIAPSASSNFTSLLMHSAMLPPSSLPSPAVAAAAAAASTCAAADSSSGALVTVKPEPAATSTSNGVNGINGHDAYGAASAGLPLMRSSMNGADDAAQALMELQHARVAQQQDGTASGSSAHSGQHPAGGCAPGDSSSKGAGGEDSGAAGRPSHPAEPHAPIVKQQQPHGGAVNTPPGHADMPAPHGAAGMAGLLSQFSPQTASAPGDVRSLFGQTDASPMPQMAPFAALSQQQHFSQSVPLFVTPPPPAAAGRAAGGDGAGQQQQQQHHHHHHHVHYAAAMAAAAAAVAAATPPGTTTWMAGHPQQPAPPHVWLGQTATGHPAAWLSGHPQASHLLGAWGLAPSPQSHPTGPYATAPPHPPWTFAGRP